MTPDGGAGRRVPAPRPRKPGLFRSFWMAGFEGADHVNGHGVPLSMPRLTQHLQQAAEDYARLREHGFMTVRESVGWRTCETRPGRFDFSSLEHLALAAERAGLQVIWTLMHYGWPRDLDILSPRFAERFARFAEAAARSVRALCAQAPFYNPINEISFLSWAVSETRLVYPYDGALKQHGFRVKRQLVRAALRAQEAIWSIDPRARIVHCDPLVHIVPPCGRPELAQEAQAQREHQFQAWDMLAGHLEPELGGSHRMLDIVGAHYYHSNQWECATNAPLYWHLRDPRRVPLSTLLAQLHARYRRPLALTETSHVGSGRAEWIDDITGEVLAAEERGVPIEGVCLYPIVDRPDWNDAGHWHHSGLWDVAPDASGTLTRVLCEPYAHALARSQARLPKAQAASPTFTATTTMNTIIVFSHLRWDFVYQRPQHVLSRLADRYRVLFVEEPMAHPEAAFLERFTPCANLEVLRPHTPVQSGGFHDDQIPVLATLLEEFATAHGIERHIAWLYTPMALPLAKRLSPERIVYDCMDELAAFKNAPRQLLQRESALLRAADVVFAGGPSLHRAKRERHPAVHCLPSSVDRVHFERARTLASHEGQGDIAGPRLGYFGVIDERMDYELLAAVADARPHWQLVMVGPVVKVDPALLPQRRNLHWLGQQAYEALPRFVAGWDVCLLPFALNEATRYISPTKTLEYMAAGRPIVSTPVADVAELYGTVVRIARGAGEFIAQCEAALGESDAEQRARDARAEGVLARTSWDATAATMRGILESLEAAGAHASPTPSAAHSDDALLAGKAAAEQALAGGHARPVQARTA